MGELVVIASLLVSLYLTYLSDIYFQSYANSLSPVLVPALSIGFGISSASIAAYLYLGIKKIQVEHDSEFPTRKRTRHFPREPSESHKDGGSATKNEPLPPPVRSRLKPIAPPHNRTKPTSKDSDSHLGVPEPKKQP